MKKIEGIWKWWYRYDPPKTSRRHHPPTIDGILAHTTKIKSGCLVWQGVCDDWGYGRKTVNKKKIRTHRLIYVLAHGPIPPGKVVMHTCDTPSCVNLRHLKLGTPGDNSRDAWIKGRMKVLRGESHHLCKVSDRDKVKMLFCRGKLTARETAFKFNVHKSTVWRVWRGIR